MSHFAFGSLKGAGFSAYSTDYLTPGTYTIPIPSGAATVTIECYGSAGGGIGFGNRGGSGGAYSRRNTLSVAGMTALYLVVPDGVPVDTDGIDAVARQDTSGGTILCLAKGGKKGVGSTLITGGDAASGTGDVKYSGGDTDFRAGGGGAGSSGNGGAATSDTGPGAANGGLSGAGGSQGANGNQAGGGSGRGAPGNSGAGAIKLSWA